MNNKLDERKYDGMEIAIIGMSCHFPGSPDYKTYWDNLKQGKELITRQSDEELQKQGIPPEALQDKSYLSAFGAIDNKDCFDSAFFGYIPEEASLMDPQIRLFHEHCWKAMEDAGYTSDIEKQKIGVFAGADENINWKVYVYSILKDVHLDPFYVNIISNDNHMCTLVSSKLNLVGPSLNVYTGCSTSLVAVNLACKSLLTRECNIALAGGVSLSSSPMNGYYYQEGMIGSKDGYCRAFDKDASGAVSGEGIGMVTLKRLSDAIKDGDHIHAVIRSSMVNNDGDQKVGFTAPSVKGQSECLKKAHKMGGIDKVSIKYIETHGTGTRLGDPIEIRALQEAFLPWGNEKHCAIGSVKTNIGHLGAAAGIAGLIKTVLSLKNEMIPASLHYKASNPEINFNEGPFYVNTELRKLVRKDNLPLRAAVSSFGVGGTNAHVILEEAPLLLNNDPSRPNKILTLSAKTEASLNRFASELKSFIETGESVEPADIAYTLQTGRKHFSHRRSIVYSSYSDLCQSLGSEREGQYIIAGTRKIVFMFSGAGSQYAGMGKELYMQENVFKEQMDKGFSELLKLTGLHYKEIIYPGKDGSASVNDMLHTQPLIFLFEYSLAQLLKSWGIAPDFMMGHSVGEYVAACLAGVFTFEDALHLVVKRGELMSGMPAGTMLSAFMSEAEAGKYKSETISLAAVNGPDQVVFSGDVASVNLLMEELESLEISSVKLFASHAGHSHHIDSILAEYKRELGTITFNVPEQLFISNLHGGIISAKEIMTTEYWLRHMRETVRFSDGVKTLASHHKDLLFIEVGAGHSLSTLIKQQNLDNVDPVAINVIRHPKEELSDIGFLARQLGLLWCHGVNIDWHKYYSGERRKKVSLPTYSFEPVRFPTVVDPFKDGILNSTNLAKPGNRESIKDWIYFQVWKSSVRIPPVIENKDCFLYFSLSDYFSTMVLSEFEKQGEDVVEIIQGDRYERISNKQFVIDPHDEKQLSRLFDDLQEEGFLFTDVIYAWGLGVSNERFDLAHDNAVLSRVYFNLARIIQAMHGKNSLSNKRFHVITNSLHKVMGNEEISYAQSLLLGIVNVLPQEFALSCRNIDVNFNDGTTAIIELVSEIKCRDEKNRIVALRNGQRWIQDYQKNTTPLTYKTVLKQGGNYMITGGLGNVGFALAKYLILNYDAHVFIVGRKSISGDGLTVEPGMRLAHLKSLSQHVYYQSADITNAESLAMVARQCENHFGLPNGIIHLAGTTDVDYFELLEDLTVSKSIVSFGPKIKGLQNIYEIYKEADLDFVWATSSLASLLGGLSYTSYSSANLFMDYFIASKSAQLKNWKSIDIGEMVFSPEDLLTQDKTGRTALKPEELFEFFEWSASVDHSGPILESTIDLFRRIDRIYIEKRNKVEIGLETEQKIVGRMRPNLANPYVAASTDTERKLIEMIEGFFGIINIGVEDNFFELGGDSLKAMVLIRRIKKEFLVNFAIKDFFTKQTIRHISTEIDEIRFLTQKNKRSLTKKV